VRYVFAALSGLGASMLLASCGGGGAANAAKSVVSATLATTTGAPTTVTTAEPTTSTAIEAPIMPAQTQTETIVETMTAVATVTEPSTITVVNMAGQLRFFNGEADESIDSWFRDGWLKPSPEWSFSTW